MRHAPLFIKLSLGLAGLVLSLPALAAAGKATSAASKLPDSGSFGQATREQIQLGDISQTAPCDSSTLNEALNLIYNVDDVTTASHMARRCEAQAITQGHALDAQIGLRIKALIAMKLRDMAALKAAGQAIVSRATTLEHEGDGHMFQAFACLFSNEAACARAHVDKARALFQQAQVSDALEQLATMEQALGKLEASAASVKTDK